MTKGRKIAVLVFVAVLVMAFIAGCGKKITITTGLEKDEIFKISGKAQKLSGFLLLFINEKNQFDSGLVDEIWSRSFEDIHLETELKKQVKDQLIELDVINSMAKKENMVLSDEEEETAKLAAKEYYASLSEEEIKKTGITSGEIRSLYEKMRLTDDFYEKKISEKQWEISDEEAKVIEVQYICFQCGERDLRGSYVTYDEDKLQEIRATAENVLQQIQAGGDFQSLAQQYSDLTETRKKVGRGMMEQTFEDSAFSLKSGECSGIVETGGALYIIECVSDYLEEETQENKGNMLQNYQAKYFKEIYQPYLEKQTVEINNKIWEDLTVADYAACKTCSFFEVYHRYFD